MIVLIENSQIKLNIKAIAVDTNVLLWTFYGNATYSQAYQKNIYPTFLESLIEDKKCKIYTTIYNICELFNVVEKNEYDLYLQRNCLNAESFSKKQYRKNVTEREKIKKILELLYNQISNCMNIVEYNITENNIDEYKENYEKHSYDVFDFALLKYCKEKDIIYVLTDDSDFASYEEYEKNIKIMTANRNLV